MNFCRTSYELSVNGKCVAAWTEENRILPPPKKFAMIPRTVLSKPELAGYSIRAKVVSCNPVNGHYAVGVEAVRLSFG